MGFWFSSTMRRISIAVIGGLLFIGGLVAFANRIAIKDWIEVASKPRLPEEVGYREEVGSRGSGVESDRTVSAWKTPTSSDSYATTPPRNHATSSWLFDGDLPEEKHLSVPFIPQAPRQIWDAAHEEACEEASMLMVRAYYDGERGAVASSTADARITSLIAFETDLGYGVDVTAEEAVKIIEAKWPDLGAEVVPMTGPEIVQRYVASGIPVILPADGKTLPNPNFRNGGPVYHMLVVHGYTADRFITNDPGTRKGEDFLYAYDGLLDSVHDWNGGDVKNGAKVMVVVRPK
jgi:hypothetical protein